MVEFRYILYSYLIEIYFMGYPSERERGASPLAGALLAVLDHNLKYDYLSLRLFEHGENEPQG